MPTAANFIIEGRMWPYGRRLCTVELYDCELDEQCTQKIGILPGPTKK